MDYKELHDSIIDEAFQEHIEGIIKRVSGKFVYVANYNWSTQQFEGSVNIDDVEYPVTGKTKSRFVRNAHYKAKSTLSD